MAGWMKMQGGDERIRAGWIALVGGAAICAGKFVVAEWTRSTAVYSDALESIVNVVAASLLLYSLSVAARPADRDHPYGHGKVEFFSAGVEGALILVAALLIVVEALAALARGPELQRLDLAIGLSSAFAAGNAALGLYLLRIGQRSRSPALIADGRHALTDVVTTAGVIVGLAAAWATGWAVLDPLVALLVAASILHTGYRLLRSAVSGLMDEADPEVLVEIAERLEAGRDESWIDVHGLRAWRSGDLQHVDLHVVVPRYLDAERLHAESDAMRSCVLGGDDRDGDVIVHFDPCRRHHCPGCGIASCTIRELAFDERAPLDAPRATRRDELTPPRPLPGQSD